MSRTNAEVLNQSAELVDYNLFSSHSTLSDALVRRALTHERIAER